MKIPKVTGIFLVALTSLSTLNAILKYYTYFVLMVSSKKLPQEINNITEETGEVPHPHELYVPLLTFIPGKSSVMARLWVLVTCSFIEESFVWLFINSMIIFYLGKYLENMWGARDFTRFLIANIIIGNVAIYVYFKVYGMLWEYPQVPPVVESPMAIIMGLFVALKQRLLNHYFLFFKGNLRIKVNYLPFCLLIMTFFLLLISEEARITFDLALNGVIITWVYLRFFKQGTNEIQSYLLPYSRNRKRSNKSNHQTINDSLYIENSSIKGDRSDQFALYSFFPPPLSFFVKIVSNSIFNLLSQYQLMNPRDFLSEPIENDQPMLDDMDNLQSKLFDLSPLHGAQNVSTIALSGSKLKHLWQWWLGDNKVNGIKFSMDKRRKQALKEFE